MITHAVSAGLPESSRRRRDLTTFNIMLLLAVAAVVITAYISNIIKVDTLTVSITAAEKDEQVLVRERETLRAEINMLSSYTRIQKEAAETLKLVHPRQQPFSLTVGNAAGSEKRSGAGK
jgi:cell division protein FtsL